MVASCGRDGGSSAPGAPSRPEPGFRLTPSTSVQYVRPTLVIRRSRSISASLAGLLLLAAATALCPRLALAQPVGAPAAALAAGDKAGRARDFSAALAQYELAQKAAPSARAELGLADALYNLGRLGEAYDTYGDVEQTYGPKLGAIDRGLVARRRKELAARTGYLSIRVSEAGADVAVDGEPLGSTPVPALVRVLSGAHDVHITKAGFSAFDGKAEVAPDGKALIDATLAPLATGGHVVVHVAGSGAPLRVLVDGVDVGAAPWEGDLPPGEHTIAGRSSSATAQAQSVDVTVGSRTAVDLVAAETAGHIEITTSDGKGVIYVDGVVKAEGKFSGDFAPGPHTVVVSRDGYQRFDRTLSLAEHQTWAETVTLAQLAAPVVGQGEVERGYHGLYGGFGLTGLFGVGGMGTELETSCGTLGAQSCSTPNAIGGGAFGYLGYTFDPVGFELMLGGTVDEAKQTATFGGSGQASLVPSSAPARTESFSFLRIGGVAALRARAGFQTRALRGTFAAGPGVSYRLMQMERDAAATDGSGRVDKYVPTPVGYFSPAITADAALAFRLSPTLAVTVGAVFWADNASIAGSNAVPPTTGHTLATPGPSGAGAAPIPTPGYNLATGPQVFLGPYVGLQFGP